MKYYSISINHGFVNKKDALEAVSSLEKNKQLISLWIQKIDDGGECTIVLLRTYVDSLGMYRVSNYI